MQWNPALQIAEVAASDVPMELLLDADPSPQRIAAYLPVSRCFVARDAGATIGACVVQELAPGVHEVMNIAVAPARQRHGCGTRLLRHAIARVRASGATRLQVGTAAWGHYPGFYEREGFRVESIDRGFFLRNYAEPVIEDGFVHEDLARLALEFAR